MSGTDGGQERESSERPILKAFCRVAPSDLFNFFAIRAAGVFFRAIAFRSRTSAEVHARLFFARLAINPPFQERQLVSLTGAKGKPTDEMRIMITVVNPFPLTLPLMRQDELTNGLLDAS